MEKRKLYFDWGNGFYLNYGFTVGLLVKNRNAYALIRNIEW